MKKAILTLIILVSLFTYGCSKDVPIEETSTVETSNQQAIEDGSNLVKSELISITPTELTIKYTNNTPETICFDTYSLIEVKNNNTWEKLPLIQNATFTSSPSIVAKGDYRNNVFPFQTVYGVLKPNEYRATKTISYEKLPNQTEEDVEKFDVVTYFTVY